MKLFVFGLGYSSLRFVDRFADRFTRICGTVRSLERQEQLRHRAARQDLEVFLFDGESRGSEILARLEDTDVLLVSIPPGQACDPVLTAFGGAIAAGAARRIVYLSTVGVYGNHQGAWIDEATAAFSESARAQARLAAEASWRSLAGDRLAVLRLGGIYGPQRNALGRLRDGSARRIVKPGQVFNRIHVDDIAEAIMAALLCGASGIFNICDDEPAPPQDVIAHAAGLMGIAAPAEEDFATADLTPMARSFYGTSNRISNARAKRDLGLTLAFPTYREGLQQLWIEDEGR
jgi:nucleoside-diphosphate-sugar epimerase